MKKKHSFRFLIIADKDPKLEGIAYDFKKWDIQTEIDDLIQIHIGIMPLKNTEIEQGKCAFKAIQYMSLGIPPVVSPVGANKTAFLPTRHKLLTTVLIVVVFPVPA